MADRAGSLTPKPKSRTVQSAPGQKASEGLPRAAAFALLPLLLVLESAWFLWFLLEPLPNASDPRINRFFFFLRSLPYVFVEGLTYGESFLGLSLAQLGHPENLPQRLPILAAASLIAMAAAGLGDLVLRGVRLSGSLAAGERLTFSFGLGVALLGGLTQAAGRLLPLAPWPIRVILGAVAVVEFVLLAREWIGRRGTGRSPGQPARPVVAAIGFVSLAGPFLALMALGAMLPTIDYDALEYHLQGPKEYFQAGRISFLPHNVYTSMPFGIEMLHLLGMEVLDGWAQGALAGQLMIALHAPLAALAIALTASRLGSPRAGWFAALIYLTTPWVYRLGVLPYVEGPLAYYHAALVLGALLCLREAEAKTRARLWLMVGLLAGGAMACKYPALVSAVLPFGGLALAGAVWRRSPRDVLAYCLGWAIVMAPWLLKNLADTGNPVYPLAYQVFGGGHWDAAMDQKWFQAHGPRPVSSGLFWQSLVDVAGRSDWQSPLYLALAPLALLRRERWPAALALTGYVLYLFLTWWLLTHRLDRFWLPILPVAAVLAGLGADWSRKLAWMALLWLMIIITYITALAYSTSALTAMNDWTGDLNSLQKSVPSILDQSLATADAELPPGSRLLIVGQAAVFHVRHPIIYNTVFDDDMFETIAKGRSPSEVHAELRRLGITHIYVDWHHIERFRSPGNYGFTAFVQPEEFGRLVNAGVLDLPTPIGANRELYRVRP